MIELSHYLKIIWKWWWLILLSTAIAAVGSYVASKQQPRLYQTTATLMVGQVIQKANPTGADFSTVQQLAESYAQMANRQPILQATVDSLGLNMGWQELKWRVYAYPIPRTQLLAITVQDYSPERAAALADEIGYQLILQSPTAPENKERQVRGDFVQTQLDDLEARIQTAQSRVKDIETEMAAALSARKIQELQNEISSLQALIRDWQANYTNLLNFLQGGDSPNFLTVIEPAQLPNSPISPNVMQNVLLASLVGLLLAVAAAFAIEYIDDTVKSQDELSNSLALTPLGDISRLKGDNSRERLVIFDSPFSPETEGYRLVRSNIQFAGVDKAVKSILITSSNPNEGKSTTAANLAIVMAQADLKTILVDADLRRPSMHQIFGVPNLGGLTELLRSRDLEINDQIRSTEVENLQLITSGPLPPNPSELLSSQRMAELLSRLEEMADVVILDSPPVLAVTDAIGLSNRVDGVVLVTQARRTRRGAAKQTVSRLNRVGANILGFVLNQVSSKTAGYSKYSQYYSHSTEPKTGARSSGRVATQRR